MFELQEKKETESEISRRTGASLKREIAALNSVLKKRKNIYNAIIENFLLYGAEIWIINRAKKLLISNSPFIKKCTFTNNRLNLMRKIQKITLFKNSLKIRY